MVTVVQGKVCAKNHPDRLSRLATIHQRYRRTDGWISYGIGLTYRSAKNAVFGSMSEKKGTNSALDITLTNSNM